MQVGLIYGFDERTQKDIASSKCLWQLLVINIISLSLFSLPELIGGSFSLSLLQNGRGTSLLRASTLKQTLK
uniref:Uncharacterized protein n=1 Tax=Kalanchoe fedtschenkoi TaxID=63787 RepID=A0A7N0VM14_KALFE